MVLDDVWSESYEDSMTLVGPFHACAPGSKIIMTTRKVQLLKKLGCDHLSACLKRLFAYCSLFSKGYMFDKDDLILLWMAEGFLNQSSSNKSMERLGLEYFEELLSRSFFQHAPNEKSMFVVHDLMNDLATYVAGEFCLRLDDEMVKDIKKEGLGKYRHMSFVNEEYVAYLKFNPFICAKNLRTFLAVSILAQSYKVHCMCPNNIEYLHIYGYNSITSASFPTTKTGDNTNNNTSTPKLKYVVSFGLPNLTTIIELSHFIHLTSLIVFTCPNMESFPSHELPNLTSLISLHIFDCPNTDASFPSGFWPPKRHILSIGRLKKPVFLHLLLLLG
ncbi:putative leucine-rich repeat domain superfamily [Helianthus annuus]|nr:putative leucine-rich repeat domain superfamily [Helianthus annuus]